MMKTVKWQKCIGYGAMGSYPSKTGKMFGPQDPVIPGMNVVAKYRDLDVYLEIKDQVSEGVFTATVLFFERVLAKKPDDLDQGDDVIIGREHICWIYEE